MNMLDHFYLWQLYFEHTCAKCAKLTHHLLLQAELISNYATIWTQVCLMLVKDFCLSVLHRRLQTRRYYQALNLLKNCLNVSDYHIVIQYIVQTSILIKSVPQKDFSFPLSVREEVYCARKWMFKTKFYFYVCVKGGWLAFK